MRGKVFYLLLSVHADGITPAYAGKSLFQLFLQRFQLGSPPRMRGKEKGGVKMALISRITPAYAGKSYRVFWRCHADEDHPRVCGEKTKKIP